MKYAIGIDIGGTNIRAALVDEDLRVVRKEKRSSMDGLREGLLEMADSLCGPEVVGVGVAVAGLVDREERVVKKSPNLEQVEGLDFGGLPGRTFSLPVFIENDANAYALGERKAGAGRDFRDFILLTLGTGIGGGVVCGGRLLDVAAELGHITVETDGLICPCGNSGCLESYASGRAVVNAVVSEIEAGRETMLSECCEGNLYRITPRHVFEYALEGDTLAREVLKNAGRYLGVGIASLVNIFSPQAVLIGGGLANAWDILVEEAKREARRRAFDELIEAVKIIPAGLSDDAGIVGAASLVFDGLG